MKYALAIVATAMLGSAADAQQLVQRDYRFGRGRITEFVPADQAQPVAYVAPGPIAYVAPIPLPAMTVSVPTPAQPVTPGTVVSIAGQANARNAAAPAREMVAKNEPRRIGVGPAPNRHTSGYYSGSPEQNYRDALNDGYANLAEALRSLNPSYSIAPVIGRHAATAGSFYIRTSAVPVSTVYAANGEAYPQYAMPAGVTLPPPQFIGTSPYRYGYPWHTMPDWLYSGTVRVDVPPVAAAVPAEEASVAALREEVRRLRQVIEEMNTRISREK